MKRSLLFFIIFLICQLTQSQLPWTTPDGANNINNTNTGNVGIGINIPADKLHIAATSGNLGIRIDNAGNTATDFSAIRFYQANTEKGVIFTKQENLFINRSGSGNLILANSGGNVGIGTLNPSARLEIANVGNSSLRVGITSNRANTFTQLLGSSAVIAQDQFSMATDGAVAWDFFNNGVNPSWAGTLINHVGTAVTGTQYGLPAANQGQLVFNNEQNGVIASNGANIYISPLGNVSASFLTNGNVGIGTLNPGTNKLAVEGTIAARKVVVMLTNPFPDYVFQPKYQLPSLDSIAQFIQANHHLPEIPSADSVAKNGLDLGGNQAALLKKIEELTLYIIEQNKKVEMLTDRIQKLENKK